MTSSRPKIPEFSALRALKMSIGLQGRADFITDAGDLPGDLVYPDEKVVVFVEPCVKAGCPHIGPVLAEIYKRKIDWHERHMNRIAEALAKYGWAIVRFTDCEVTQNPEGCASTVIAQLKASEPVTDRKVLSRTKMDLANMARIDAATRIGGGAWREFVAAFAAIMATKGVHRARLQQFMTVERGWKVAVFKQALQIALWHEMLDKARGGYLYPGPLFDAVMMDCGFRKRKDRKNELPKSLGSLGERRGMGRSRSREGTDEGQDGLHSQQD